MTGNRPRLAVVTTAYYFRSHSDVLVSRWLAPRPTDAAYGWPRGGQKLPATEIASLYIAQRLENDIGCEIAARHGVPVFESIQEALTLGTGALAVDGVLLIGEHGNYPLNEFSQKLYPRREHFDEIVTTFRQCGRSVPLFNDKHFSYDSPSAIHMVNTASEMNFPLMAGSSIPVSMRVDTEKIPRGSSITAALGVFYSSPESYGYHSIELLQSALARRVGGETGIIAVTSHSGESLAKADAEGVWPQALLEEAVLASKHKNEGDYREHLDRLMSSREANCRPVAFCFEHADGLKSFHIMLPGYVEEFSYAIQTEQGSVYSASSDTYPKPNDEFFPHFAVLDSCIEEFIFTGVPAFPVEHTLFCTLAINAAVRGLANPGVRFAIPEIQCSYTL